VARSSQVVGDLSIRCEAICSLQSSLYSNKTASMVGIDLSEERWARIPIGPNLKNVALTNSPLGTGPR